MFHGLMLLVREAALIKTNIITAAFYKRETLPIFKVMLKKNIT